MQFWTLQLSLSPKFPLSYGLGPRDPCHIPCSICVHGPCLSALTRAGERSGVERDKRRRGVGKLISAWPRPSLLLGLASIRSEKLAHRDRFT